MELFASLSSFSKVFINYCKFGMILGYQ